MKHKIFTTECNGNTFSDDYNNAYKTTSKFNGNTVQNVLPKV